MKMAGGISSCRQLEQNVSCWYAEALMSKTYDIWSDDGIFSFFFFFVVLRDFPIWTYLVSLQAKLKLKLKLWLLFMDGSWVVLNMAQEPSQFKGTGQAGSHGNLAGIWNILIFQYLSFVW